MQRKVSYIRIFGVIFLVCSILLMATGVFIAPSINTVTGIVMFILSVCYLVNPPLVYTNEELYLKNIWGKTKKTYRFSSGDVNTIDDTIFLKGKRYKHSRIVLEQKEYLALIDHILDRLEKKNARDHIKKSLANKKANYPENKKIRAFSARLNGAFWSYFLGI